MEETRKESAPEPAQARRRPLTALPAGQPLTVTHKPPADNPDLCCVRRPGRHRLELPKVARPDADRKLDWILELIL